MAIRNNKTRRALNTRNRARQWFRKRKDAATELNTAGNARLAPRS